QKDGDLVELAADPNADLVAFAFKTQADPHVGKVTWFRVFSGTLKSSSQIYNTAREQDERVGQLFYARGKEHIPTDAVVAGDIGAVTKLDSVETGHTVTSVTSTLRLDDIAFPHAAYSASVKPKTQADLD